MKPSIRTLALRLRVASFVALAAIGARLVLPGPPDATLRGVAEVLGASVGGTVEPDDFVWEASRGVLADSLLGRRVVFLARSSPDSPRDLYRAAVRVTLEGKPVSVRSVVNLTDSSMGDEQGLVACQGHVAYATVAFGAVQQVTLLDLSGMHAEPQGLVDRVMGGLTNLQTTGSLEGVGRTEVSTNLQAQSVRVSLDDKLLGLTINEEGMAFAVSLETGEVVGRPDDSMAVSSMRVPQLAKPPILWAVDTVRSVTGPEFIAWLEDNVFDARDMVKRAGYHAFSDTEEVAETTVEVLAPPPPPPEPKEVGADGFNASTSWPPTDLRPIWKKPSENEGVWRQPRHKFLQKNEVPGAKEEAPSYFYQTHVRPDPKRPWSKVWMVAMDSRQLALGMEGGIDDPKPLTGARGEGRIPREPEVLHRAVGAFNGGFKTTHGEYGMMVARRVLLPPKAGAATIMLNDAGKTGFGTWPASDAIPKDMLSFRQNLDPLIDGGRLNPSNRKQWGWHLHTTGMLTHRSGLCLTSAGHMVYAWGPEVTAETLGNAMIQAGCTYAVHLDMNPRHTAFAYIDARKRRHAELLHPGMEVLPERFIVWSPKDFFYLTLRRFGPAAVEGLTWEADEGTQPPPAWAPAVFRATAREQAQEVQVMAFSPQRTEFRIRAGTGAGYDDLSHLDPKLAGRVLASLVTGAGSKADLAMHVGGKSLGSPGAGALIWVDEHGQVRLAGPNQRNKVPDSVDWMELPLLADGGTIQPRASEKGASRHRAAMCTTPDGTVWLARAQTSSYLSLLQPLQKAGCEVIASLDRGQDRPARVYRTGTPDPPVDRYDVPTLFVLGKALGPGAFRWRAE